MSGSFIDTNIVIYSAMDDHDKADRARAIIERGPQASVQVLNEFANVARGKLRWSWSRIESFLDGVTPLVTIHPITVATHDSALRLADRYGFHIYDALIVAAALATDCDVLLSEDMQHGLLVHNRLTIVNPFI